MMGTSNCFMPEPGFAACPVQAGIENDENDNRFASY
jgi:hypothetical protein